MKIITEKQYNNASFVTDGSSKIDVRTSGYANFAADTIPSGTGSMTVILSQYFDNLQITIRGRNDLIFAK